ncbi:hypothetical protein GmHk_09G025137 [Glycine max]|nr:hypothetical protein GmHk_09G025137 [Glycine max]
MRGEKGGERGRGEYKNLNRVRNEHRDHTSYYFTNFPESHNEEDFWKTFMRWGKGGQRFGFVKFREVDDLLRLGRQLDNIFLENMKMFVNQPRFSRPTTYGKIRTIESDKKKNWAGETSRTTRKLSCERQILCTIHYYAEYNIELLQKILVGRLKKPKEIYNNNEILLMEGVCSLKMRYIGDNLVLLTAMDREDIVDVIKKPEEWLTDLFEIIGPWDAKATPANRLTWLRISGEQGVL